MVDRNCDSTIGIDDEQWNHTMFAECQCRYSYILFFFAGWFIVVQGLMSVGLALCLLSINNNSYHMDRRRAAESLEVCRMSVPI